MTVLFADCRDFTALTHEHGPQVITALVDQFFRRSSEIVVAHDGILDNFRGDAVLAFFNVPIHRDGHVEAAIGVAARMQEAVPEINTAVGAGDLLRVGIGITTGLALATTLGSDHCRDYTLMGDVVNIGSRLQGFAAPGEILVSEDVYRAVEGSYPDARERVLELKGIPEPVRAYVLGPAAGDGAA